MRVLFVASLAMALVALPAARAAACRCTEAGPAKRATSCSCCGPATKHCCCGSKDEGDARQLRQECACSLKSPQTPERPAIEIPAPAVAMDGVAFEPSRSGPPQEVERSVWHVRGEPHPEVLLPLLL
jgi:hypothetical protein